MLLTSSRIPLSNMCPTTTTKPQPNEKRIFQVESKKKASDAFWLKMKHALSLSLLSQTIEEVFKPAKDKNTFLRQQRQKQAFLAQRYSKKEAK